jgi:hypothetical protein
MIKRPYQSNFFLSILVLLLLAITLAITACEKKSVVAPIIPDDRLLIVDSAYVVDIFPFDSSACVEVLSSSLANADSIPTGTVALVKVVSTSCYRVHVTVVDSLEKLVRVFDRQFGIFNRKNEDKNRGVEGYITWDGKDGNGQAVPIKRYAWLMDFNFGAGHTRKVRADIRLD